MVVANRQSVRLGHHGEEPIFERVNGLHANDMGLAVVFGADLQDPEVLFEEHGKNTVCEYFEILDGKIFDEELGPKEPRDDLAELARGDHGPTNMNGLQRAFALDTAARVNEMVGAFRKDLEPAGGGVFLIRTSRRLQHRNALIRVMHAAQAQSNRSLSNLLEDPQPLEDHAGGYDGLYHYLYTPVVLLASPQIRGFTSSRPIAEAQEDYCLVVLDPPHQTSSYSREKTNWQMVFHNGLPPLKKARLAGPGWVRALNSPAAELDPRELVKWWTERLNLIMTELTDLGRYRSDDGLLDAPRAYRTLRTFDRIIANCVRIQADVEDHVGRVTAAFEVMSLFPGLLPEKHGAKDVWTALGSPREALKILTSSFASAPEEIKTVLVDRGRQVTETLLEETLQTVVPGRAHKGGVLIGADSKATAADQYVSVLFPQLRNALHGYELDSLRKRQILESHTGHISAAFPELVVLYVIAMVANPADALNGIWIA